MNFFFYLSQFGCTMDDEPMDLLEVAEQQMQQECDELLPTYFKMAQLNRELQQRLIEIGEKWSCVKYKYKSASEALRLLKKLQQSPIVLLRSDALDDVVSAEAMCITKFEVAMEVRLKMVGYPIRECQGCELAEHFGDVISRIRASWPVNVALCFDEEDLDLSTYEDSTAARVVDDLTDQRPFVWMYAAVPLECYVYEKN